MFLFKRIYLVFRSLGSVVGMVVSLLVRLVIVVGRLLWGLRYAVLLLLIVGILVKLAGTAATPWG